MSMMKKYVENIKKENLRLSIASIVGWFAALYFADSLVHINIDYVVLFSAYVALFLVILYYGSIMYLIYKNDKFSKLLRIALYTIYSLCFLMSCYVLLTPGNLFELSFCCLLFNIIFAISGLIYFLYLALRRKLQKILDKYSFLEYCFFAVTYFFVLNFVRFYEF
ncbi:MAG: hypothetical protein IKT96_01995 [Paludibacteraceae bacterium]|nr:hypothetical protein [Paludibacteraceae bacterium]